MRAQQALMAIVLLRFAFGLSYALVVPPWEAYDEPGHFAYAALIAAHGALPGPADGAPGNISSGISGKTADAVPNPQRIQPPGYYAALGAFLWLSGSGTAVSRFTYPPMHPFFYANTVGVNYALHPRSLPPERQQVEIALRAARIFSLLLSLVGVPFAYLAARRIWPHRCDLPLAAAALFALWPQFLFSGSMVTNDGLTTVLGAAFTWLILKTVTPAPRSGRGERPTRALLLALSLCVVGAFIKLNLLILILPLALAALMRLPARQAVLFVAISGAALLAAVLALQSLPAVLLPFSLRGSRGESVIAALWENLAVKGRFDVLIGGLGYALHSGFGLFGWGNVPLPTPIQAAWVGGLALAGVGGAARLVRTVHADRRLGPAYSWVLLAIPSALIAAGLALCLFYLNVQLLISRYLLPGLCAVSLLLVAGWQALGRHGVLRARIMTWGAVAGLVALGALLPWGYIARFYERPPLIADSTDSTSIPNHALLEIVPGAQIVGYSLDVQRARAGDVVPIAIYWRATAPLHRDYTLRIEIIGPDDRGYGWLSTFPGRGMHPTSDWLPGQTFIDRYAVPIRADFPAPAPARIRITMQHERTARAVMLPKVVIQVER